MGWHTLSRSARLEESEKRSCFHGRDPALCEYTSFRMGVCLLKYHRIRGWGVTRVFYVSAMVSVLGQNEMDEMGLFLVEAV